MLRNPNVLRKVKIEVYSGWGKDAAKCQWRFGQLESLTVTVKLCLTVLHRLRGNHNALGKVKFLFPNEFSVYMHDTPTKNLFNRNVRSFSHGCIRLSQPIELLETFSTFNETVDFEKSKERLEGVDKAFLYLKEQVPVDVIYLTAYVDYDGVLQFRNDIYGYDKMQLQSFRKW